MKKMTKEQLDEYIDGHTYAKDLLVLLRDEGFEITPDLKWNRGHAVKKFNNGDYEFYVFYEERQFRTEIKFDDDLRRFCDYHNWYSQEGVIDYIKKWKPKERKKFTLTVNQTFEVDAYDEYTATELIRSDIYDWYSDIDESDFD